jgi:hypothetical protein
LVIESSILFFTVENRVRNECSTKGTKRSCDRQAGEKQFTPCHYVAWGIHSKWGEIHTGWEFDRSSQVNSMYLITAREVDSAFVSVNSLPLVYTGKEIALSLLFIILMLMAYEREEIT